MGDFLSCGFERLLYAMASQGLQTVGGGDAGVAVKQAPVATRDLLLGGHQRTADSTRVRVRSTEIFEEGRTRLPGRITKVHYFGRALRTRHSYPVSAVFKRHTHRETNLQGQATGRRG